MRLKYELVELYTSFNTRIQTFESNQRHVDLRGRECFILSRVKADPLQMEVHGQQDCKYNHFGFSHSFVYRYTLQVQK